MIFDELFINYALVLAIFIVVCWIFIIRWKFRKLLLGKDAKTLEDSIKNAGDNLDKLNQFQKEAVAHFLNVEKRLGRSIQAVETVRFNPFKGMGEGGSQSFSTSFLNENGNGVVLSSMYSRDRISVFSKPLQKFESTFELTDEEKTVINESKKLLK